MTRPESYREPETTCDWCKFVRVVYCSIPEENREAPIGGSVGSFCAKGGLVGVPGLLSDNGSVVDLRWKGFEATNYEKYWVGAEGTCDEFERTEE